MSRQEHFTYIQILLLLTSQWPEGILVLRDVASEEISTICQPNQFSCNLFYLVLKGRYASVKATVVLR